jgi:hypothetical protein
MDGPSGEIFKGDATPAPTAGTQEKLLRSHGSQPSKTPGKPGKFKAGSVTHALPKGKPMPKFWAGGKAIAAPPLSS